MKSAQHRARHTKGSINRDLLWDLFSNWMVERCFLHDHACHLCSVINHVEFGGDEQRRGSFAGRELRMKGSLFLQMLPELAKALDISMPLGA